MTQTMKTILHSILSSAILLILSSCGDGHHHENGHHHEPQHGGILIECGKHEKSLELVHHHDSGDLEIYVKDGHHEHPVLIKQEEIKVKINGQEEPILLQAVEDPKIDKTVGNTDHFEAKGALLEVEEFKGTVISVTIKGKTYSNLSFHYEAQHDHDHDPDHDHDH